ncbi:MAG: transketolase [Selenomonas ruminantium]|nr:transketolase [Selenomonas ruminantium]
MQADGLAEKYTEIENHARNMRKLGLDMALNAGDSAAHFGGGMSLVDILAVLYFGVMNTKDKGMKDPQRDRFILSKGHGVLGYYAALVEAGLAPMSAIDTFEHDEGIFFGHPVINREAGIEFSNGSLGMGLALGIGVAIANRKRGYGNKVYVLLGDGECNEGSVWEAFMAAPQYKLKNLVAIIDKNTYQLGGENAEIMSIDDIANKLRAFNWEVRECDGHDVPELYNDMTKTYEEERPLAIVAHTVKGKGFAFAEGNNSWHHAVMTQKQYELAVQELNKCQAGEAK